jgi:cytochrome c biogenesis protein CcdA
MSLAGAFFVGLAHVFQPCEDKAIVAAFVMGASKRMARAIPAVILYGLGITVVNTLLGFVFSYAGVALIEEYETLLKVIAGVVTIAFGLYMLSRFGHLHVGQHEGEADLGRAEARPPGAVHMVGVGLVRGMALCPVELAVLTWALSTGDVMRGTLMLLLFGLGTTVSLVPVAVVIGGLAFASRGSRYGEWLPRIAPLAMILIGVFLTVSPFLGVEV